MKRHAIKQVRMKKAVNTLIADIKTQSFPADMIILFGSIARNSISEHSDMDICIVSEEDLSIRQIRDIENYFYHMAQGEFKLDFVYCDRDKLASGNRVFESIRNEGRIIYGQL